jgi:hypothetical protein
MWSHHSYLSSKHRLTVNQKDYYLDMDKFTLREKKQFPNLNESEYKLLFVQFPENFLFRTNGYFNFLYYQQYYVLCKFRAVWQVAITTS